jgi:ribosomal protein S12 methylthiotransferase
MTEKKQGKIDQIPMFMKQDYMQRTVSTGKNYAYLKIGEGCSNMCTYCAIPYIRGLFISRPIEDIIEEAKNLAEQGIKELIIIAQDTTKYGVDIYGKSRLAELLNELCKIDGIKWIRFLYAYPEGISNELIDVVKKQEKISKYFDIPIQHISNNILKRMNRKTSKEDIENLISKIRKEIPDCTLRTSLIVGFPGEKQEEFEELYDFVQKTKFDKLGVFEYSKEEGTPAATMPNQIHHMTKKSRYNKIMSVQQKISHEKMETKLGKEIEVLVEEKSFDGKYFVGRTKSDVPEIDGIVYVKSEKDLELNQFVTCKVVDVKDYDLIAEKVK